MAKGYISVHRRIVEHAFWEDKPFTRGQAWIDLMLSASYKDNSFLFDGNLISIERGQFITSIRKLGERWGWSRTKVCKFLTVLESEKMIIQKSDKKKTLITVINYAFYQDIKDTEKTLKSHRKDTEKTLKSTINNENNDNNDNKKVCNENLKKNTPKNPFEYFEKIGMTELIVEAKERSKNMGDPISYANKILKNWEDQEVKTLSDLQEREKKSRKTPDKPQYANFDQREYTEDEYEQFFSNVKKN